MSFWTKLKTVFHAIGVGGQEAAPVVTIFNPAIGAIVGAIATSIVNVEQKYPDGSGAMKQAEVINDAHATAAAHGLALDSQQVALVIDGFVRVLNDLQYGPKVDTGVVNLGPMGSK